MSLRAVLFDVDGTLIDSNDLHVEVWETVLREAGHAFDRAMLHAHIGQGSDLYVPALLPLLGEAEQTRLGKAHGALFKARCLDRARPFPGARELLARVHGDGRAVVLASSAGAGEVAHYVALLDAAGLVDVTTSKDDVAASKPAPDLFAAALARAGAAAADAIVVGDTPFDIAAAQRCGIAAVAVRSGGFPADALAGAAAIYDDVAALLADYDGSPLAG